jgi:hypothetical protein
MHVLWGILTITAGLLLLVWSSSRSNFIIYRFLYARSKILWGKNTYRFHQVVGVIVAVFGVFVAIGVF